MYYYSNIYSSLPSSTTAPNLQSRLFLPPHLPVSNLSVCLSLSLPPSLPLSLSLSLSLSLLLTDAHNHSRSSLCSLYYLFHSSAVCPWTLFIMRWDHLTWRPSTRPVQYSSQSKPTVVARENQWTNFESGFFFQKRNWKKDRVSGSNTKLPRNTRAATWRLQCLKGFDGACAHYVMVSKFQWKPFWLATQRDWQNDWTATQNSVNFGAGHHNFIIRSSHWRAH